MRVKTVLSWASQYQESLNTMKFARDLKRAESHAPAIFKGSFLNYNGLKKFLKFRGKQLQAMPADSTAAAQAIRRSDLEFLQMLGMQLREVDRRFEAEATAVIAAFDAKKTKRKAFRLHRDPQQSDMDPKIAHDLAERARCCREYAETNAQALRKIAKKHDKVFGLKTGQQFVQACWRGDIAVKSFLSAPVLSELAAVEALLRSKAGETGHPVAMESSADGQTDSDMDDPDTFKCGICLDTIYLATALECGHRFCARCVIAIAVGHDGNRGDVDHLLASGPVGCSTVPCPQCRATEHGNSGKGVFFNAARLPHMDELIKSRYPADWQRRKEEDELEQQELRAAKAPRGLLSFLRRNKLQDTAPSSASASEA